MNRLIIAEGENREQLFDMEKDPGELKNLIADPALTSEVERHRRLLEQWRKDTHDEIGKRATAKKDRKRKK